MLAAKQQLTLAHGSFVPVHKENWWEDIKVMLSNYRREIRSISYFMLSSCIKAQYNGNCCCNRRLETCWEQCIPLLSRRTKAQNTMSQPMFPTQSCPGVCAHSGVSFIWHRNSGALEIFRANAEAPLISGTHLIVHSEHTGCSHKQP